jgi:iron complex outermembrane receptor protein
VQDSSTSQSTAALTEIIVTAQKRPERLQDVPVPVTAIDAQTLVESNQLRLEDYFSRVPGLNVTTDDFGTPLLTIRGLTTGAYTNPTVSFLVDDVPYGSSSDLANGQQVPDIDPSDLARVEVLRGPQGTLYGASSLGGLIKYVTIDPSTTEVSGRVQAGMSTVYNGAELGYNVRASINVPLTDTIAIRASGFTRIDPGYIDNPVLHIDGVNEARTSGGRLSALWQPSDQFSLKLGAIIQNIRVDGSQYVDLPTNGYTGPPLGDLQQNNLRGTGWLDQTLKAFSANLKAQLGPTTLTAVSGYSVNSISDAFDATPFYGTTVPQSVFGVTGSSSVTYNKTSKFTQEIRLSASTGDHFEWLVGAFYDHENSPGSQGILAVDPATGIAAGDGLHYSNPSTFEEYAAFADLTYHFTDKFDVQVGGRESHNQQTLSEVITGPYVANPNFYGTTPPIIYPQADSNDHSFVYLLTPRFKISSDLMVYARLASGYRPGGPNLGLGLIPPSYKPDTTRNYEIGFKADALAHTLSFDASIYYIDWKDIQLFLTDPTTGTAFNSNGSRAKSQGVELSLESRPLSGLTITAWIALNDAELTAAIPPSPSVEGSAGDRLPYSSRFSSNLSVERDFSITGSVMGFAGGAVSYIGSREGVFTAAPPRQTFPGYAKTDLRGGVKYESWEINLFANNVADKRGVLNGGFGTFIPYAYQYIQPRTIGIAIVDKF